MKLKYIKLVLSLFVATLVITSCSSLITKDNLTLYKGIEKEKVVFDNNDVEYEFKLTTLKDIDKSEFRLVVVEMPGANSDDVYYYAFKDNKLIYWGYPFYFTNHKDPIIRAIGEEGASLLKKAYSIK